MITHFHSFWVKWEKLFSMDPSGVELLALGDVKDLPD